jgi:hypothetical protein
MKALSRRALYILWCESRRYPAHAWVKASLAGTEFANVFQQPVAVNLPALAGQVLAMLVIRREPMNEVVAQMDFSPLQP